MKPWTHKLRSLDLKIKHVALCTGGYKSKSEPIKVRFCVANTEMAGFRHRWHARSSPFGKLKISVRSIFF